MVGRQVRGLCGGRRGQNQAHQLIVETVFDRQQDPRHLDQRLLGRDLAVADDAGQLGNLFLNPLAQLAEPQHSERVADFLQQLELRREFVAAPAAAAHEYIEDILDLGQILLDRGGHRAHQLHAGRGQAFSLMLDRVVDGQQFGELERRPHRGDTAPGGRRAGDVVQQVVEQVDRRIFAIARLAEFVQRLDLAVGLTQQTLQRRAALQAVGADRLQNGADDPPQLKHRLGLGDLLELFGHFRENFQILHRAFAANVSQQTDLESRPQAPGPLHHGDRLLALPLRLRLRRLIGFQIEQQQRSLGQQGTAAHGPQVVEQGQQHQGQIPAARQDPLQIGGQLHHGAHQRVEAVDLALLIVVGTQQVAGDVLHLLGEKRRAVYLDQAQNAMGRMQLVRAFLEQRALIRALRVGLERGSRVVQSRRQFLGDDVQSLRTDVGHSGIVLRVTRRSRWPCAFFRYCRCC